MAEYIFGSALVVAIGLSILFIWLLISSYIRKQFDFYDGNRSRIGNFYTISQLNLSFLNILHFEIHSRSFRTSCTIIFVHANFTLNSTFSSLRYCEALSIHVNTHKLIVKPALYGVGNAGRKKTWNDNKKKKTIISIKVRSRSQ